MAGIPPKAGPNDDPRRPRGDDPDRPAHWSRTPHDDNNVVVGPRVRGLPRVPDRVPPVPPSADPFPVLAFRSTKRTADRLDALRPYLTKSGKAPLVGALTRADLLRLAVEEGLICLERRARRAGGDR